MSELTADSLSMRCAQGLSRFAQSREPATYMFGRRILTLILLGLGRAGASHADTVVVTADRMIDVVAGKVVEHPRITITDGRITAVGSVIDSQAAPPDGARRIDLPGMTLL